jgi:TP901 family phage tail tape measure protein
MPANDNVGLHFETTSFKEFNKQLQQFSRIAKTVDKNMKSIAKSVGVFDRAINLSNSGLKSFLLGMQKVERNLEAVDIKVITIEKVFEALTSKLIGLSNLITKISPTIGAGLKIWADEFQKFGVNVDSFVRNDTTRKLKKTFEDILSLPRKSIGFSKSIFGMFRKGQQDIDVRPMQEITKAVNNISSGSADRLRTFSLALGELVRSLQRISELKISSESIKQFVNVIKTLFGEFTGKNLNVLGVAKNALLGIVTLDFRRLKGAAAFRKSGLLEMLQKFSAINFSNLKNFSNSIRDFALSFRTLAEINISTVNIGEIKRVFEGLTEIFAGKRGGGFRRFFSAIGSLKTGNIFGAMDILTGRDGIINRLSSINITKIGTLSVFSNALVDFADTISKLKSVKFDKQQIKNVAFAMDQITNIFARRRGIGVGRFRFGRSLVSQINSLGAIKIQNLEIFSKAVTKFSKLFRDFGRAEFSKGTTKKFLTEVERVVKKFINLAKQTAKLDPKGFETISKSIAQLAKALGKGLEIGGKKSFEKAATENMTAYFKQAAKVAETTSPSKRMMRMGVDLAKGLAQGLKRGLGKITSLFRSAIMAWTKPLSFLKDRFVITFSDISRAAKRLFRTIIGTTIEFETAFVGVLKTLDTSTIEGDVGAFIADLRSDLMELATGEGSLVAGLENAFVTLSKIAETGGQLGIAAQDITQFTNVVGQLTMATDLSADSAGFFLGQFTAITGSQNFEQIGGAVVALGNSLAVTESQLTEVAKRIVAAGSAAGFSEAQILGWAAAIRASGLNAEAGSTAFIQFTSGITKATQKGGVALRKFADAAELTTSEFIELFEEDASEAIKLVIEGLGDLTRSEMLAFEEQVGMTGVRLDLMVSSLAAAEENSGVLSKALSIADENMQAFGDSVEDYNALQEESAKRNETTAAMVNRMKNAWRELADTIGQIIQPAFNRLINQLTNIISGITNFLSGIRDFGLVAKALGIDTGVEDVIGETAIAKSEDAISRMQRHGFGESLANIAALEWQPEEADALLAFVEQIDTASAADLAKMSDVLSQMADNQITRGQATLYRIAAADIDAFAQSLRNAGLEDGLGIETDELSPAENALQTIKDETAAINENVADIVGGLGDLISGDFEGGIKRISDAFGEMKVNIRQALTAFVGGDIVAERGMMGGLQEGAGFEVMSTADLFIEAFDKMFGIDLGPVHEFIADHVIEIFGAGFALITGSSIGLTVTIVGLLLDIFDVNFGDMESEIEGSKFLTRITNAIGFIGAKIGEIFTNVFTIAGGEGTAGEKVGGITKEIFGGVGAIIGTIAPIIGEGLATLFIEGIKRFPEFFIVSATFLLENVVTPFLTELGSAFVDPVATGDVAGALEGLLSSAITILGIGLLISGSLGGPGIIAGLTTAITSTFSLAIAAINPVTLAIAVGALLVDIITGGPISEALKGVFEDLVKQFLPESLVITLVQIFQELKTFLEIFMLDIRLAFEDVKAAIPGVGRDEDLTAKLEAQKERVQIIRDLFREMDETDSFTALMRATGGDVGFTFETGGFANIRQQISEQFGVDPALILESLKTTFDEIGMGLQAEDIGFNDAFARLFEAGFDPSQVRTILTQRFGASEQEFADAFVEAIAIMDLSEVDEELANKLSIGGQGLQILEEAGQIILTEEQKDIMKDVGQQLIDGLGLGMEEYLDAPEFVQRAMEQANTFETTIKDAFEIESPSKMTMRIGRDLIDGLVTGMKIALFKVDKPIIMIADKMNSLQDKVNLARAAFVGLAGAITGLAGLDVSISVTQSGLPFGGQRQFGGAVSAGTVYEVLENNLPFELFATGDRTFMLPNVSGMVLSPNSQAMVGGDAANAAIGGGNINNSTITYDISVPVTFESVPTDVSDAQLADISNTISRGVQDNIDAGLRESTLVDRANRKGRF